MLQGEDLVFYYDRSPSVFTKFKCLFSPARWNLCVSDLCVLLSRYVWADIRNSSNKMLIYAISEEERAWKHVTFRKYVAATRNSPGYVVLNHRPRRNARTYTPPGSGGTFLRKVSRKARSLFRKTSSNVPRRLEVLPPPYPKPPSAILRHDKRGTLDGILMKSHAVYELPRSAPTMASNLHPGRQRRYPNLFRLSCKLAGMSEVAAIQKAASWTPIWFTIWISAADGQWDSH